MRSGFGVRACPVRVQFALHIHYLLAGFPKVDNPKGAYTLPLWNLVLEDHPYHGFWGPNSITAVYMNIWTSW